MSEPTPEQIEAGIAAFENEPTDAGWLDESDMVRAIYTAMRALERPSETLQEAVEALKAELAYEQRKRMALEAEKAERPSDEAVERVARAIMEAEPYNLSPDEAMNCARAAIAAMQEQSK